MMTIILFEELPRQRKFFLLETNLSLNDLISRGLFDFFAWN